MVQRLRESQQHGGQALHPRAVPITTHQSSWPDNRSTDASGPYGWAADRFRNHGSHRDAPTPTTCCSALDPDHDLPGAACAALDFASCVAPLPSLYCQWNPGPGRELPDTCCAPIDPNQNLPTGSCETLPDYYESALSAGAGVCQWNPIPGCPTCPAPACVENGASVPFGTCASISAEAACQAQAPDCAWGCDTLPDLCCPLGAAPPAACAALSESACGAAPACQWSVVGACP